MGWKIEVSCENFVETESFRTFVPRRDSITVESCRPDSETSGRKGSLLFRPVELIEGAVYEPMHLVLGVVRVSVLVYVPSEENVESNRFCLVNRKDITQIKVCKHGYRALSAGMIGVTDDVAFVVW